MRLRTLLDRVTAALLCVLLVSCGATRGMAPTRPDELTQLVLFIQDMPDGTVTHSWRRAEELDLSRYRALASSRGAPRRIVLATGRKRDCDEENRECIDECMTRPLARGFGHITSGNRGRGGKLDYCNKRCMQPYLDCQRLQELQSQKFTAAEDAVEWLKSHRKSVLLGSVLVIAGVTFVVVSAGTGLVILAPAVLLAHPKAGAEPYMAGVAP